MLRQISILVIIWIATIATFAQTKQPRRIQTVPSEPAWEYLWIRAGVPEVESPIQSERSKLPNLESIAAVTEKLISVPREAVQIESMLDEIGKAGWELVAVVEYDLLFKRRYDAERSRREAAVLKTQRESLLKRFDEARSTGLLDLDDSEKKAAESAEIAAAQKWIEEAVASLNDTRVKIDRISRWGDRDFDLRVRVDGTGDLLTDGNKYRSSEANKLLLSILKRIEQAMTADPRTDIYLQTMASVYVRFREKEVVIASGNNGIRLKKP